MMMPDDKFGYTTGITKNRGESFSMFQMRFEKTTPLIAEVLAVEGSDRLLLAGHGAQTKFQLRYIQVTSTNILTKASPQT